MNDDRSTTDIASAQPLDRSRDRPLYRRGAWGRLAVALFPLVAVSGLLLTFVYRPDPARAWWSVASIAGGDLSVFRDLHRWGGEMLLVAAWLHLFRVFMVGAYRRLPGWGLSVTLTVLVAASAASGWALRFDAGAARTVGEDGLLAIYALHVLLLPAAVFLSVWVFRRSRAALPVAKSNESAREAVDTGAVEETVDETDGGGAEDATDESKDAAASATDGDES